MGSARTPEFRWDFRARCAQRPEGKNAKLHEDPIYLVAVPRAWKLILLPGFFIVDTDRSLVQRTQ